jgi:hypothetical protein
VITSPKKRFLILGLAFIVMLNSLGIFAFTYLETGFHRAIEYSAEPEKKSELLSLTGKEFSSIAWIGERDFIFNGNVYDCDGLSAAKGKINVRCHSDAEETNLKNSLADNFENGSKNVPVSKPIKDIFKVLPVFQHAPETNNFVLQLDFLFHYSPYSKQIPPSADLALNSPPPKFS